MDTPQEWVVKVTGPAGWQRDLIPKLKRRDAMLSILPAIVLGCLLCVFLSELTWALFDYGMGFEYTRETIAGYRGFISFNYRKAMLPSLALAAVLYIPLYRSIRKHRRRRMWFG